MAKRIKSKTSGGIGCAILFLLPFAAGGIGTLGMVVWTLANWAKAKTCKETPATLQEASIVRGDDSRKATGTFEYQWQGQTYQSKNVSLYKASDNFGSYQDDLGNKLGKHKRSRKPLPCYVNPKKPSEAILDRTLRWEFLAFFTVFAEVFGLVGLGGLVAAAIWGKDLKDSSELEKLHPDEPWKWNRGWLEGIVDPSNGNDTRLPIFIMAYWNMACIPLWVVCPWKIYTGHPWAWVGMIIPAIGILIAAFAIRAVLRRNKYGASHFHMLHKPGEIGGALEGAILIEKRFNPDEGIDLRLCCQVSISRGDDPDDVETLYEVSQNLDAAQLGEIDGKMAIPVYFQIPHESENTVCQGHRKVTWDLLSSARIPGVDYKANFEVPVFKTKENRGQPTGGKPKLANLVAESEPLKKAGIHIDKGVDGTTRIKVRPFRNLGAVFGLFFFALIWIAVSLSILFVHTAWILFPVALIGFFSLLGAVDIFLQSSTIQVDGQGVHVERGWFPLPKKFDITREEILGFDLYSSMRSRSKHYYKVVAELHSGKRVTIAKYVEGAKASKKLAGILGEAM